MTKKQESKRPAIFVPKYSFVAQVDGKDVSFREDEHIIEGNPILKLHPDLFVELNPEQT